MTSCFLHAGTLPDWWPKEFNLKTVEKAIQDAVGATDGKSRVSSHHILPSRNWKCYDTAPTF